MMYLASIADIFNSARRSVNDELIKTMELKERPLAPCIITSFK